MDPAWAELGKEIIEISPYALFVVIAFASAYFMFKEQSEKAIEEMRKAFDDALKRVK